MAYTGNYLIQAKQAKERFRAYDQDALVKKLVAGRDKRYIYVNLLDLTYRIDAASGDLEKCLNGVWTDGNSYPEVMTLLDLVCDSREDRCVTGRWKSMEAFGLMFHRHLLEDQKNPTAEAFDRNPAALDRACRAMGGRPLPGGDVGYAIPFFEDLALGLQFWHSDEEFPARVRYLWDENANRYLRYETMYFATDLLISRLFARMERA